MPVPERDSMGASCRVAQEGRRKAPFFVQASLASPAFGSYTASAWAGEIEHGPPLFRFVERARIASPVACVCMSNDIDLLDI